MLKKTGKILALVLAVLMLVSVFAGCSETKENAEQTTENTTTDSNSLLQEAGVGSDSTKKDDTQTTETDTTAAATEQIPYMGYGLASSSFDLVPFSSAAGGREQILNLIWPRLVYLTTYGGKLEDAEMWLAKSITKKNDVTYDVELYDNIYDSKGNHITAEDVKWSYEMNITEGQLTEVAGVLGDITINDDYNLTFTLSSPGDGKAEVLFGFHRLTICDKEWYESTTDDEHRVDAATAAAYRVKEYVTGSKVVLEAVDNYWQTDEALKGVSGQQNVKTIYCPIITEKPVRAISVENGEVDYASVDVSNLNMFFENGAAKPGYNVVATGGATAMVLFLNMDENSDSPLANNPKLREAVLCAIDRESAMLAAGYDENSAWVCYDIGTPLMAGYDPAWQDGWFNYDPDRAVELLKEAGYPDGVTLRFMYTASFAPGMVAVVQECLESVGIHVEAMSYDQALYNQYKYDSSQWDLELDFKGGYSLIDDWYNLFAAGGYTNGGANFCKDQTLYDALDKAMESGAQEDFNAVHQRLQELALGTGLYAQATLHVAQDGILTMPMNNYMQPMMNAWTFAADFTSKAVTD